MEQCVQNWALQYSAKVFVLSWGLIITIGHYKISHKYISNGKDLSG